MRKEIKDYKNIHQEFLNCNTYKKNKKGYFNYRMALMKVGMASFALPSTFFLLYSYLNNPNEPWLLVFNGIVTASFLWFYVMTNNNPELPMREKVLMLSTITLPLFFVIPNKYIDTLSPFILVYFALLWGFMLFEWTKNMINCISLHNFKTFKVSEKFERDSVRNFETEIALKAENITRNPVCMNELVHMDLSKESEHFKKLVNDLILKFQKETFKNREDTYIKEQSALMRQLK